MATNLNHKSRFSIQSQLENETTNERTHAKIKRPEKWTDLKQQQNRKRQIITTTTSSCSGGSCGLMRNLHLDDENENCFRANSIQMPSMITSGGERPQHRRKQRLGCPSAGGRAGQSNAMGPTSSRFNGNVSLRTLVTGLLHQIVIVSLILHKLPALRATRTTPTLAQASNGQNVVEPTTRTFDHHLGNNLHNFNQGYLIELPSTLIYTDQLLGSGSQPSERAEQKATSEHHHQQQQQRPSSLQRTKEELQEEATNGVIGDNQRHRQEARSFIKAPSEVAAHNELMQTVHRHGPPPPSAQLHNEAAAADDNQYQRRRRTKRHLGPMLDEDSVAMMAAAANQYATPPQPQRTTMMMMSKRTAPDCHKLAALWLYLHLSYPMLSNHLVELATGTSAPKAGRLSHSIGRILGDAERLTATATRSQTATMSLANHRHSPAWLERISSNPVYGKLVQHLRAKQLSQLNQQQQPPSSSSGGVPKELAHEGPNESAQRQQLAIEPLSSRPDDANGEQMASSMVQPQSAAATNAGQVVYGRLVNYPHEIGLAADNSNGMARTLEKLRLLNHHSKQHRQLASGDIVETNKIPLAAADLADQTGADRSRLAESATDLARNNFVYGTMLLRPSSANDQDNQRSPSLPFNQHHDHHQRPMSALRELAGEQEHQRRMHSIQQQPVKMAAAGSGQISSPSSDTNSGRILTSPPSDNKHSNNNNNNYKSDLRQATDKFEDGASASDELLIQQRVGLAAAEDGDGEAASSGSNSGDEFEGEFHSSPLKQAEVRLLRSLDHQHQPPAELMQRPKPESVTRRSDLVID